MEINLMAAIRIFPDAPTGRLRMDLMQAKES